MQDTRQGTQIKKQPPQDGLFDINRIIKYTLRNWYLFLISIPLALAVVYVYHRYTIPVYRASTTILLKSTQNRSFAQSDLLEGFGLSPEMRNIENQIFIIKSKKLIKKAVDLSDFEVEYFRSGHFKDTEIYHNTPFFVEFDSLHPQLVNVPIYISCNNNILNIEIKTEGTYTHIFKFEKTASNTGPINYIKKVSWGEMVTTPYFSFRIKKSNNNICEPEAKYFFRFRPNSQTANIFKESLAVNSYSEGSSIMNISVYGSSPGKLVTFLENLNLVIMENNMERKNDKATRTLSFISNQLKNVSDTLRRVQKKLLDFRKSNHFVIPSEYSQIITERYLEKEKALGILRIKKEYYKYIKEKIEKDSKSDDFMLPAVSDEANSIVNQMILQLIELKDELETLNSEAHNPNPYIISLSQKINIAKNNLKTAIKLVIKNIELKENEITHDLTKTVDEIKSLPDMEREYADIERDYKLNNAIYTFLLQKHSENQIAKASNTPDNEIIDSPSITGLISPNKKNNYSKAFIIAILLPIGIIFLHEILNTKVRGKEDLEHLQEEIPIIGFIMHSKNDVQDLIHEQPHSVISEAFRALRTKIKFMSCENKSWVITITSTNTGEGKTFSAQNLASAFSISGKKTALLGFDLRKPKLSELFDLNNETGLSNYLTNQVDIDDICYKTKYDNLYIIPSGAIPPNPSELISNNKTEELFKILRVKFDVIIIDTPPIGLVADARILMDYSDCHLYVVRANYTDKEHMGYSLNNLLLENIKHMGIILNDIPLKEKGYGYYSAVYYG